MDSLLFIGSRKGLLRARSHDQQTWEIDGQSLNNWSVPAVAISPGAPNKVFAGTRGDGVWVSEDFAETWSKPCYGKRGPGKVRSLTVDPHDSKRIYAGCAPIDIFVSEDEGKNWDRLDALWDIPYVATITYPVSSVEPHVRKITVDPSDPNVIYAALQVGYIAKSTDRGKSWALLDKNLDADVHTVVVDPSDSNRVFVATGGHDARLGITDGRALYFSKDSGESWAPIAMNFTQEYSAPFVIDPGNPKRMYSAVAHGQPPRWRRPTGAEATIIRSSDGGESWEPLEQGIADASMDFTDVIVADNDIPGRLYAAYRKGDFYTSGDGGDSWKSMGFNVPGMSSVTVTHA